MAEREVFERRDPGIAALLVETGRLKAVGVDAGVVTSPSPTFPFGRAHEPPAVAGATMDRIDP
jgi:hypothetical protein